jgi:hypothetical protein
MGNKGGDRARQREVGNEAETVSEEVERHVPRRRRGVSKRALVALATAAGSVVCMVSSNGPETAPYDRQPPDGLYGLFDADVWPGGTNEWEDCKGAPPCVLGAAPSHWLDEKRECGVVAGVSGEGSAAYSLCSGPVDPESLGSKSLGADHKR